MVDWKTLSGSINHYIRGIWKRDLLRGNEELLKDYMDGMAGEEDGVFEYLDKQSYTWIKLTDEEVEKIKAVFIERILGKRFIKVMKYNIEVN